MVALQGKVIHGDNIGKALGFPTANLDIPRDKVQLGDGVYAAWVKLNRKKYKSAFVVTSEPLKIEAYLIDYDGEDFYGEAIEIDPVQKISEVEKYGDEEELIGKIRSDIEIINLLLKQA